MKNRIGHFDLWILKYNHVPHGVVVIQVIFGIQVTRYPGQKKYGAMDDDLDYLCWCRLCLSEWRTNQSGLFCEEVFLV
ncbi:hypothetical protein MASR2M79_08530 [Aminivibrio sp.]